MVREQALQYDQGLKRVIVLRPKDENGEPYFITDDQGNRATDSSTGKPTPAYKPEAVDVGKPGVLRSGYP